MQNYFITIITNGKRQNRNDCYYCEYLKEKGIRIVGIGMQGHWGMDYPTMEEMDAAMKAYSETGCKLMITELDMDISS
jgi:GH35 family endo-1,4-beta-xylanase